MKNQGTAEKISKAFKSFVQYKSGVRGEHLLIFNPISKIN